MDIPDDVVSLPEKLRNDAFLILKEALHNIIRHSAAQNVIFSTLFLDNTCTISLKDDGIGMGESSQVKRGSHGNGLINMKRRAQEAEMGFEIHSSQNKGTEIMLRFKI